MTGISLKMRSLILFVLACLLSISTEAQVVKAVVFENKTHVALVGIRIVNLKNKQSAVTDNKGKFSIQASVNDILTFSGFAYVTDTVMITNTNVHEFFMVPQSNMLNEVKVQSAEVHLGKLTDPDFHGQTMVYQRNKDGSYKGGVTLRLSYWKRDEKRKQHLAQKQYEEVVRVKISKVFNDDSLAKFLPLKKDEMPAFIELYIPSVKVFTSNDFNLLYYLEKCYKEFMALPPEKRRSSKLTPVNP